MKKIFTYLFLSLFFYIAHGRNIAVVPEADLSISPINTNVTNWADPAIYAYTSTNICIYDSVLLGVTNLPNDAISYNWQFNGAPISGATNIPYPAKQAGIYTLSVVLANGTIFITNQLTVALATQSVAPVISENGSTTFCNGQSVVLSSSDPGNIQWQKDNINIKDANFQTYTATVGGIYRLKYTYLTSCPGYSNEIIIKVTNIVGSVITEASHSLPVCLGTSFKISTISTGIQWQKDGVNINGAVNQSLDVTDNGKYRAVQTNAGGGCPAFSNEIVVTSFLPIQPTPTIIATGATSCCAGNSVLLSSSLPSVSAAGLQWRINGTDILGATNQTYIATQSGNYAAYVTGNTRYCNNTGTPSNIITVTVNVAPTAPVVTASGNLTFCVGSSIILTSNREAIQWQKDAVDISGETILTYNAKQSGTYTAIVRGGSGCNGISNAYTITVISPSATPTVVLSGSANICNGSIAALSANVGNVQWQKDGVDIPGAVFQSYLASSTGTYRSYVNGSLSCGANYSNGILITVSGTAITPTISASSALIFCSGSSVPLLSNVANIQWQLNGVNISNAIATIYSATQSGSYTAVATNGTCTATSNALVVAVITPNATPVISATGTTTICNGSTAALIANVGNVQWQKDGVDISGATFQGYTAALPGVYRAYQPSALACGITYSNTLTVVVNNAPLASVVSAIGATSFCSGSNVTLTSSIVPIQWRLNGADIGTVTSSPLVVSATSGSYTAATINGTCTTNSNAILVAVSTPSATPLISAVTPANICIGSVVTLSSNISGIQWQKDGLDIAGAIFQAFNASQSGAYRAYVPGSGACGFTYSNIINVTVSLPPTAPVVTASGTLNLCSGGNVVLTSNISPVLWQKDGVSIGGTTPQSLTVAATGTYMAYVNSSSCNVFSTAFVVTVNSSITPVISSASSSTICGDGGLILSSTVTAVQWQLNGGNIAGATNQIYIATIAGSYTAVTTGNCNVTSNTLTLTIGTAPATPIVTISGTANVCSGGSVILTSSITPIQWVKDNVDISGATAQTYTATAGGIYKAYTTNGTCIAYSVAVVVTVGGSPPIIAVTNGGSLAICSGSGLNLTSTVAAVQWQLGGVNIVGATTQTYTATVAGVYTAVATGTGCATASNALTVTVAATPTAPTITATGTLSFCNGDSITLASTISGVQWLKDGVNISGATNQTYSVTQAGKYKSSVSNGGCLAFSNELTVMVNFPTNTPTISANGGLNFCAGTTVTLSSNFAGVSWQKDFATVAINTQTYSAAVSGTYRAVVFGGTCPAYSNVLIVTVSPSLGTPTIVQSGATSFCDGGSVTLASNFSSVQWLKDGVAIAGATSATYSATQGGKYKASASNGTCTTYSNEIIVTVNFTSVIPTITANNSATVCTGTAITLTSSIAGVTWQKDFITVAANAQTFTATESGNYRAVLFGGTCSGYSNSIQLIFNPSPGKPTIVQSGASSFCDGGSVILVSNFTNVQWLKDGLVIVGATSSTYTATVGGIYKASATNGTCTTYSNEIPVTVNVAPSIPTISASGSLNICSSTPLILSSNKSGVTWQKDFATFATGVQNISVTESGTYRAVVFGSGCPGYSNDLVVAVSPSLGIPFVTATGATTFCDGSNVILVSTLAGVQWLKDGVNVANTTGQIFTASQVGIYKAAISNGTCINYSNEITVAVNVAPLIPTITPSSSLNICDGTTVTLTSNLAGVTWQKDFTTIALNTQSILASQAGSYRAVLFSNTCTGYSNSVIVSTTPSPAAPVITALGATTFCDGGFVTFASNISGVQWLLNGVTIPNAFSQTYTAIEGGNYSAVVYGNNCCNGFSNIILVTVTPAAVVPIIVNTSSALSFCPNTTVNLVSSLQNVTWQKNGVTYANPTNNNQVLPVSESGTYRAVIFGSGCPGYSNAITLTALTQPLLPIIYRVTQNFCDTGDVVITSTINSGSMQWQKDSLNIVGANTVIYTAKQSGNYRFIITLPNVCPSYSQNLPLVINTALKPVVVWDGTQFKTFTNYSTYQWYLNNVAILSANLNVYKPTVPGNYKVVVTSTVTCVLSSDIFPLLVTAVTTPTSVNGITIKQYPNPTKNEAWIEFSQVPTKPITIKLLNATGAVVQTVVTRQRKINIATANYSSGLYFIEVIGTDDKIVYKLIINK